MAQFAIELSTQWLPRVLGLLFSFCRRYISKYKPVDTAQSITPLSPTSAPSPPIKHSRHPPHHRHVYSLEQDNHSSAYHPSNPAHPTLLTAYPHSTPPRIPHIKKSQKHLPPNYLHPSSFSSPTHNSHPIRFTSGPYLRSTQQQAQDSQLSGPLSRDLFTYKELEYPINYSLTLNPSSVSRNDQDMLLAFKIHTYFRNAPSISFIPRS